MSDGKYNFGDINVDGQAMFGDQNTMEIYQSDFHNQKLNVSGDQEQLKELILALKKSIDNAPEDGQNAMSKHQKADLSDTVIKVVDELKKDEKKQERDFLQYCLQKLTSGLASLPSALKLAVGIKTILGF